MADRKTKSSRVTTWLTGEFATSLLSDLIVFGIGPQLGNEFLAKFKGKSKEEHIAGLPDDQRSKIQDLMDKIEEYARDLDGNPALSDEDKKKKVQEYKTQLLSSAGAPSGTPKGKPAHTLQEVLDSLEVNVLRAYEAWLQIISANPAWLAEFQKNKDHMAPFLANALRPYAYRFEQERMAGSLPDLYRRLDKTAKLQYELWFPFLDSSDQAILGEYSMHGRINAQVIKLVFNMAHVPVPIEEDFEAFLDREHLRQSYDHFIQSLSSQRREEFRILRNRIKPELLRQKLRNSHWGPDVADMVFRELEHAAGDELIFDADRAREVMDLLVCHLLPEAPVESEIKGFTSEEAERILNVLKASVPPAAKPPEEAVVAAIGQIKKTINAVKTALGVSDDSASGAPVIDLEIQDGEHIDTFFERFCDLKHGTVWPGLNAAPDVLAAYNAQIAALRPQYAKELERIAAEQRRRVLNNSYRR